MKTEENVTLERELEHFRTEKEKIRNVVGQIGGKDSAKKDHIINFVFFVTFICVFIFDIIRHLYKIQMPLPLYFLSKSVFCWYPSRLSG